MNKFDVPQDLIKKLEDIKIITSEIEQEFNTTKEKLSQLDRLQVDIYHDIEDSKLDDPSDKVKIFDELDSCLSLRRYYKERLAYLDSIRSSLTLESIEQALEGVERVTQRIESKQWEHKINDELKQELLSESNKLL
jgi:hypothetical protein